MCLSVPGKIVSIDKSGLATLDYSGTTRKASNALMPDVKVGDWVLISAKMIVQKVKQEDAEKTLALWDEIDKINEGKNSG